MHVPPWFAEDRRHVTRRTLRWSVEHSLTARGCRSVETSRRRSGRRYRELIEVKRRQLRRDQIRIAAHVAKTCTRRDRKLGCIIETRIVEGSLSVHLEVRNERVPVRNRTPARPRMKIDAGESERGRDQGRRRLAIRTKSFAVEKQFSVKLSRSPTLQDCSHRRFIDAQQSRNRLKIRTQRHDRADVQIAGGPAVETPSDAR